MYLDRNSIILKYHKNRDPELREKIVVSYRGLVEYIAKKLAYNRDDIEDLKQVGTIGLLKSIERYEPSKDTDFSTFATPNIIGEIKHYFRDKNRLVKIPRRMQELYSRIRTYIKTHSIEYGQSPTVIQIAEVLEVTEEEILEAMEAGQVSNVISLDAPAFASRDKGSDAPSLLDNLGMDDKEEVLLGKESLKQALIELDSRERKIIFHRFFEGLTQSEIAEQMGCSQTHISRLLESAIRSLRKRLEIDKRKKY